MNENDSCVQYDHGVKVSWRNWLAYALLLAIVIIRMLGVHDVMPDILDSETGLMSMANLLFSCVAGWQLGGCIVNIRTQLIINAGFRQFNMQSPETQAKMIDGLKQGIITAMPYRLIQIIAFLMLCIDALIALSIL